MSVEWELRILVMPLFFVFLVAANIFLLRIEFAGIIDEGDEVGFSGLWMLISERALNGVKSKDQHYLKMRR